MLLTIGVPGAPKPYMSGEPFHRCTHTALSPQAISTSPMATATRACTSSRPNGRLLFSWGKPGTDPGQFNIPHNICCDQDGWVYVADRENHRVQVFDGNGKFQTQWNNMHRPSGLYLQRGREPRFYIGEIGGGQGVNYEMPNIGPRVSIYSPRASCWPGWAAARRARAGQFISPHGLAVDSRGDISVGEVSFTNWRNRYRGQAPRPASGACRSSSRCADTWEGASKLPSEFRGRGQHTRNPSTRASISCSRVMIPRAPTTSVWTRMPSLRRPM